MIGNRITDADPGDTQGVAITSMTTGGGGTWQYATTGSNWVNVPGGMTAAAPLLLNADADTRVRFVPSADATSTPSIVYRGWDKTAGGVEGSLSSVNPAPAAAARRSSTSSESALIAVTDGKPVSIAGVQVNDGNAQRSVIRSLTVTFSGPVSFAGGNAGAAFQLSQVGGGNVGLNAGVGTDGQGRTVVTLAFSGQYAEPITAVGVNPSLVDGVYALTVFGPRSPGRLTASGSAAITIRRPTLSAAGPASALCTACSAT